MRTIFAVLSVLAITATVAVIWAKGIERMKEEHPDYKGEDFFDEGNIH